MTDDTEKQLFTDKTMPSGSDRIEPLASHVEVSDHRIFARLKDGRTISVPIVWSWRLSEASPRQRRNFRLIGAGHGIHWPDIDEDISIRSMLEGGLPLGPTKAPSR